MKDIVATLKKSVAALEASRIPYALGGGAACWARGGPPATSMPPDTPDVDVMVRPEDAEQALERLAAAGMRVARPPEQWLFKAWDDENGGVLVDLIFEPAGLRIDDEVLARADRLDVAGMRVWVMAVEDVLTTKLMALDPQELDYTALLLIARALREQIDWAELRARTSDSPYAAAFFTLVEGLGLMGAERPARATQVRVA